MNALLHISWSGIEILGALVLTAFISLVLLQTASQQPQLKLKYQSYVVQSGSMEPTIMTGDVVFVRPGRNYGKDDIITYRSPEGYLVTHRIVDVKKSADGQILFQTKGDNNHTNDSYTIVGSAILGRYWFAIPKLGYIEVYGHSRLGLIVIVSVICGWIVADFTWQFLQKDATQVAHKSTNPRSPPPALRPSTNQPERS